MSAEGRERLLDGLLGPGEAELTCEECFEQLDRYVELELAGKDADGMAPHLQGCSACAEDHEALRALVRSEERRAGGAEQT